MAIGSLAFSIRIDTVRGVHDLIDELLTSWMAEESDPAADDPEGSQSAEFEAKVLFDAGETELESFRLRYAAIQDVLIVVPLVERLDRLGGSLWLCRLNDRVLSLLEQIRLPMILETYAAIDEAVLTAWS